MGYAYGKRLFATDDAVLFGEDIRAASIRFFL
jgi:hypothetical protein